MQQCFQGERQTDRKREKSYLKINNNDHLSFAELDDAGGDDDEESQQLRVRENVLQN